MVDRSATSIHVDLYVLDVEARGSFKGNSGDANLANLRGSAGMDYLWRIA